MGHPTYITFSVRVPAELHVRSTSTAQRRGESLNALKRALGLS